MITLDEIDLAIAKELQKNGRSSNREVARVLGVSEGTIRQRLKKLESAKALRLGLVTNALSLGQTSAAFVRIKATPREAQAIARKIAAFPDCSFVALTVGRFDIVALFNASSRQSLADVIDNEIAVMVGVVLLDVREPVAYAKHRYDLIHIP